MLSLWRQLPQLRLRIQVIPAPTPFDSRRLTSQLIWVLLTGQCGLLTR